MQCSPVGRVERSNQCTLQPSCGIVHVALVGWGPGEPRGLCKADMLLQIVSTWSGNWREQWGCVKIFIYIYFWQCKWIAFLAEMHISCCLSFMNIILRWEMTELWLFWSNPDKPDVQSHWHCYVFWMSLSYYHTKFWSNVWKTDWNILILVLV